MECYLALFWMNPHPRPLDALDISYTLYYFQVFQNLNGTELTERRMGGIYAAGPGREITEIRCTPRGRPNSTSKFARQQGRDTDGNSLSNPAI